MPPRGTIRKKDPDSGTLYLRDGVTLAFFLPPPFGDVALRALEAFDRYLAAVPAGALRWAVVGADAGEWKPLAKTTVGRCRALLTGDGPRKRSLTAFFLADGDSGGDAPGYGVQLVGNKPDPEMPDELNLLQMFFPSEVVAPDRVEVFVADACRIAEALPYVSGYGSPGLQWSELESGDAFAAARALAKRHLGYDVQYNELGRSDLDTRVRGARWLTFLGPALVARLGGAEVIRGKLPRAVGVQPVGHGLLIRAGALPEIGDRNRREDTPLLRAVAAVLEPVTLFDEAALLQSEFGSDHEDEVQAWERRFLGP